MHDIYQEGVPRSRHQALAVPQGLYPRPPCTGPLLPGAPCGLPDSPAWCSLVARNEWSRPSVVSPDTTAGSSLTTQRQQWSRQQSSRRVRRMRSPDPACSQIKSLQNKATKLSALRACHAAKAVEKVIPCNVASWCHHRVPRGRLTISGSGTARGSHPGVNWASQQCVGRRSLLPGRSIWPHLQSLGPPPQCSLCDPPLGYVSLSSAL